MLRFRLSEFSWRGLVKWCRRVLRKKFVSMDCVFLRAGLVKTLLHVPNGTFVEP